MFPISKQEIELLIKPSGGSGVVNESHVTNWTVDVNPARRAGADPQAGVHWGEQQGCAGQQEGNAAGEGGLANIRTISLVLILGAP